MIRMMRRSDHETDSYNLHTCSHEGSHNVAVSQHLGPIKTLASEASGSGTRQERVQQSGIDCGVCSQQRKNRTSGGLIRTMKRKKRIVCSRNQPRSYSYVALLKLIGPVWPVLRFHVLHQVNQGRGEGCRARPFPGREFKNKKRVGIQLDEVAAKDCRNVLDEDGACSVDPVWCDKDVDSAEAYYSLATER